MTLQFEEVLDKSNGVLVDRDSTPEMIYRARENPSQTRLAIQAILFLSQDVLRQMRQNHKIKNNYLISVIEDLRLGNSQHEERAAIMLKEMALQRRSIQNADRIY